MDRRKDEFLCAIREGNISEVRRLVLIAAVELSSTGKRLMQSNRKTYFKLLKRFEGFLPLQSACEKKNDDIALFLIENGAPISKV